jgi:hypothetical protein
MRGRHVLIIICYYYLMSRPSRNIRKQKTTYSSRLQRLRQRVGTAAQALADEGVIPTVARVRAALRGGSPNDLAPVLKHWKQFNLGRSMPSDRGNKSAKFPIEISDLLQELWHRAMAAAAVDLSDRRDNPTVSVGINVDQVLQQQIQDLRRPLEHESDKCRQLRSEAVRHNVITRELLVRIDASEAREKRSLVKLKAAEKRISQLNVALTQAGTQSKDNSKSISGEQRCDLKPKKGRQKRLSDRRSNTLRG